MIAESTVTAALVGVIIVLTKVIEWLMQRAKDAKVSKAAAPYNGSTDKICDAADKLHDASIRLDISVTRIERAADKLER